MAERLFPDLVKEVEELRARNAQEKEWIKEVAENLPGLASKLTKFFKAHVPAPPEHRKPAMILIIDPHHEYSEPAFECRIPAERGEIKVTFSTPVHPRRIHNHEIVDFTIDVEELDYIFMVEKGVPRLESKGFTSAHDGVTGGRGWKTPDWTTPVFPPDFWKYNKLVYYMDQGNGVITPLPYTHQYRRP